MGHEQLKAALIRDGAARARALWEAAEQEVADRRRELASAHAHAREDQQQEIEAAIARRRIELLARAGQQCRQTLNAAEQQLLLRLFETASDLLPELRERDRIKTWQRLASELPQQGWDAIRVHPQDQVLAAECYPDLRIEADPAISGGLDVELEAGRIHLDNTLEVRLRRAWPDLSRALIESIRSKVNHETSAAEKT